MTPLALKEKKLATSVGRPTSGRSEPGNVQEIPDLPGESQRGFKLLKRIRRGKKRNFFCLVLVFYEHLSSKIKAIKRYTVLSLPRAPYFYVSRDPQNLPSLVGLWGLLLNFPKSYLSWCTCSLTSSLSQGNLRRVGEEKQVNYLFPWMCLQTSPMEVGGKWGRRCLNHLDAHQLRTEKCSPFGELFLHWKTMDRESKSNPGKQTSDSYRRRKKNNCTVFKQLMTSPVTISLSS